MWEVNLMATATFNISPNVANWLLGNGNRALLDDKTDKNIEKWQKGLAQPTYNQLLAISKKLRIPLGFLFLNDPPNEQLPLMNFRTIDSTEFTGPSRELIDTVHDMELIQDWMSNYLRREGYEPWDRYSMRVFDKLRLAKAVRDKLAISDDWYRNSTDAGTSFKYLRKKMEEMQILVMQNGVVGANTHRALNLQEFRAFTLMDKYAPLIFINGTDSINGKLFSLLHEFVHVVLGKNSLFNDFGNNFYISKLEIICNAVAAEVLAPDKEFIVEWNKRAGDKETEIIRGLARIFNCGEMVIARKALDNHKISSDFYAKFSGMVKAVFIKQKEKKSKGGDYYRTVETRLDKRFLRLIANDVKAGHTRPMDAYRLTNTTIKTFDAVMQKVFGEAYGR